MHRHFTFILLLLLFASQGVRAAEPSPRFIDISVRTLWGGTYMTNNYNSAFPAISHLNTMMGVGVGAGVGVRCNVTRLIAVGTELNLITGHGKMDMAVASDNSSSVSNVFQENAYTSFVIPFFVSFSVPVADKVVWELDPGLFLGIGLGGSQKTTIYDAKTNPLGQLITSRTDLKTDFYSSADGFLNSAKRVDFGLHLATRLRFNRHFSVGLRSDIGLSNSAYATGIVRPSVHSVSLLAELGWRF